MSRESLLESLWYIIQPMQAYLVLDYNHLWTSPSASFEHSSLKTGIDRSSLKIQVCSSFFLTLSPPLAASANGSELPWGDLRDGDTQEERKPRRRLRSVLPGAPWRPGSSLGTLQPLRRLCCLSSCPTSAQTSVPPAPSFCHLLTSVQCLFSFISSY